MKLYSYEFVNKKMEEEHERDIEDIKKIWNDAFNITSYFDLQLYSINKKIDNKLIRASTMNEIILRGICKIYRNFKEIMLLTKNGFAESATARWRDLYELIVIIIYINSKENRESISNEYKKYQENIRKYNLYRYVKRSREKYSELESLDIEIAECKRPDSYKWAGASGGGFGGIQNRLSNIGDFPIYYIFACGCIHSGGFESLGTYEEMFGEINRMTTKYNHDMNIAILMSAIIWFYQNIEVYLARNGIDISEELSWLNRTRFICINSIKKIQTVVYDEKDL